MSYILIAEGASSSHVHCMPAMYGQTDWIEASLSPLDEMDGQCSSLLQQLSSILAAKKNGAATPELQALLSRAALDLIKLRKAARQKVEDVENHKAETTRSRAEVEASNLQLQNLLYEKNYYTKEIASCRNFRSKYTDEQIGLVEVQQFLEEAPQRFKEGTDDEHKLQQQRLEYEKHQRLELLNELEAVKQRKADHDQVVAGKRKHLEDAHTLLENLRQVAQPLRAQLGLPPDAGSATRRAAAAGALLPIPLFVLYHQLAAVKEAYGEDICVSFSGSEKDAESWAQASGGDVFERQEPPPAKKRRKADADAQVTNAYMAHPLTVALEVTIPGAEPLSLHFGYLPRLECVTVRATDASRQPMLGELFPGDTGASTPGETPHQRDSEGSFDYDASRPDRPYLWAQHLAGLDFLPALNHTGGFESASGQAVLAAGIAKYRQQQRVQAVLKRLRAAAVTPAHASANASSLPGASESDGATAQPVKRIRTWEEIVSERAPSAAPAAQTQPQPQPAGAAVKSGAQNESDEEEGQLKDTA